MAARFAKLVDLLRAARTGSLVADARLFGEIGDFVVDADDARLVPGQLRRLWRARVVRPDDMVVLDFSARGLRRSAGTLVRETAGVAGVLIVCHQPQSLADAAYLETTNQDDYSKDGKLSGREPPPAPVLPATSPYPTPVPIRAAGQSRVAFTMPDDETALPLTLDALLDACRRWPLALDGAARNDFQVLTVFEKWQIVTAELDFSLRNAREALGDVLDPRLLTGLDAAATRIAAEQVTSVRAKRQFGSRAFDALATLEVAALVRGEGEAVADTRAAAGLFLNLAAGARASAELGRAGIDFDDAIGFVPGIAALIQRPHEPSKYRTAIEMPWRLIGSPLSGTGFTHATQPVTHGNRTELWHTRMGARETTRAGLHIDERATSKLRYLWSPDYPAPPASSNPNFSLDGKDRQMIVKLTAGYDETNAIGGAPFRPRAVNARRVMLSALGGQLEADRRWTTRPIGVDMMAWTHKLSQGRDSYVRVEYAGFLFPLGHAATLVKISERKFEWRGGAAAKDRVALLRQRFFLIIREKSRTYPNGDPQPDLGRTMPFTRVEVMLDVTPDLAQPGLVIDQALGASFYNADISKRMAFWPARTNPPVVFDFPLVGVDDAGNHVPFAMPLMFVSEVVNRSGPIEQVRTHYNAAARKARRTADTQGATIRFAPAAPGASDVDLPTPQLVFESANPTTGIPAGQSTTLQQQPIVKSAKVRLAGVERLTGQVKTPDVGFDPLYVQHGFGASNPGTLFLKLTTQEKLEFGGAGTGSDAVGGVATPSLNPSKLSAAHGVMSGASDFADGLFKPADFFPDAKLLGFFNLKDLLKIVPLGPESPQLATIDFPAAPPKPAGIETRFRLVQTLPASPIPALITNADGRQSTLDLTSIMRVYAGPLPPEQSVEGILTNFKINLAGCLIIHFDRLRFLKKSGAKPDVDVDLNPDAGVTFGGPLEFINKLKEFIPSNGFSDPPDLQVTPQGITAGYSLGLPNVQVGVLSLSNISLGASFTLPFTGGAPTARFNFAERHNTFNLTVSLLGGGGFFAIVVGADGVKEIEAQLDFGAQVAINLGVASGSVYIKAGFYFHYAESPERVEFEGFVELGGRLSVLGLISVSLTFHLSLAYEAIEDGTKADGTPAKKSRLFGQATLVVEIEILFFSASVKVKVEKTFVGSDADPSFAQLIDETAWNDYCGAFA